MEFEIWHFYVFEYIMYVQNLFFGHTMANFYWFGGPDFSLYFWGGVHDACDFSAMLVFDYGHSPKPAYQKNVAMVMYGVWDIPWIAQSTGQPG